MEMLFGRSLFDLSEQSAADLLSGEEPVWEALDRIKDFVRNSIRPNVAELRRRMGEVIRETAVLWQGEVLAVAGLNLRRGDPAKGTYGVFRNGERLDGAVVVYAGAAIMDDDVELGPGTVVEPGALIKGPTIIGGCTEVRQGAYIRGSCHVGRACVVGHATEMKNTVMLDAAKAGHFAYLGDSILGRDVNLGAGTKLANLKINTWPIRIRVEGQTFEVNRRKFGAILGDRTETGCNSVTSPGTIMGPGCLVVPTITVPGGYHPPKTFITEKSLQRKTAK